MNQRKEAEDLSGFYRGYLAPSEPGRARFPAELQISYRNVSEKQGRATVYRPEIFGKFAHFSRAEALAEIHERELSVSFHGETKKITLNSGDGLYIEGETITDGLQAQVFWRQKFLGVLVLKRKRGM